MKNERLKSVRIPKEKKAKGKGCLIAVGIAFAVIFVAIFCFGSFIKSAQKESGYDDPYIRSIGIIDDSTEITKEQMTEIKSILVQCGIPKLSEVVADEELNFEGVKGYRVSMDGANNIILYMNDDGTVNNVRWADIDFYKDGKILASLDNYILSPKEISALQFNCEETIKGILNSPQTANFPNVGGWEFKKDNGVITVQSYVDAQNGFGVEVRSQFQFIFGTDGTTQSLIFDGKEYIK